MSWKDRFKALGHWLWSNLMAPGVALVVIVGGFLAMALGAKVQIGGLLGKLLGNSGASKAIDVANSVPADRVDDKGKLIPQGQPDARGDVQAVVVPIHEPSIFSDPTRVTITPPGKAPIEVELPKGVTNKDVDKVVILSPTDFVVTVKEDTEITTAKLDDLLKKYGG